MSQRPYPQLQLHLGLVFVDSFEFFGRFMCNNMCKEFETQSIETVKVSFLYLSRGDFLKIRVFYSIFEHICKNLLFSYLH